MRTQLILGPADQGRPLSWEEFSTAEWLEGHQYQLIGGRLEVSPIPNLPHSRIVKWLERLLDRYSEERPEVINLVAAPAHVFVPGSTVVSAPEPDLAAYNDFPADLDLEEVNWPDISPILVAEVVSEDTAEKDLDRNPGLYLQVPSIREYWVIDPRENADRPSMTVFRRRGQRWQRPIAVPAGGTYTPERLLPGFSLVLAPRSRRTR